jgi:hypothetical protein
MSFHKEILFEVVNEWTDAQLLNYIHELEDRMNHTKGLVKELKQLLRRRKRGTTFETGPRDGR